MSWLAIVGAVLKIALTIFNIWAEKNHIKKAIKKEAVKDAIEAISSHDTDAYLSAKRRMR